jgi:hypothetical protein
MAYHQIRFWLETKVREQTMTAAVVAIDKFAMPQVKDAT